MRGTKAWKQFWKQTGGVFVLTALALPFFLACIGFALDAGNLYIHRSRLQNAADAAALAGGREFANEGETVAAHPHADTEARSYTNLDMATLGGGTLTDERYKAQQVDDDTILYGVRLTETVPLYFMRIFGMEDTPVVADAAVAIGLVGSNGGDGHVRDLFIFRRNFHAVNTIDNPDNFNIKGQLSNCVTFNGTIAFTDGSGNNVDNGLGYNYDYLQYSTQTPNLHNFFTKEARDEGLSVNDAIRGGAKYAHTEKYEDYDMAELGIETGKTLGAMDSQGRVMDSAAIAEMTKKQVGEDPGPANWSSINWNINWGDAAAVKALQDQQAALNKQQQEHENYQQKYQTAFNQNYNSIYNGKKDMHSSDLAQNVAWRAPLSNGDGNASITIDGTIPGDASDPVYVYLDESIYQVNFNVYASNERPLVVVYQGTGKLQMNMSSGATFSGIVYAPNVNEGEGLLINANGGTYEGTIIANAINLQGGKGTFIYKDFGVDVGGSKNGNSSGGTKTVSGSSTVRLAPTDGMDWT